MRRRIGSVPGCAGCESGVISCLLLSEEEVSRSTSWQLSGTKGSAAHGQFAG